MLVKEVPNKKISKKIFLERDSYPKYYFHCTQSIELANEFVELFPRVGGLYRPENEPEVSRICVSSKISGCISAIYWNENKEIRIYRTKAKAWTPFGVYDSEATGEKWLLEPNTFKLVATINLKNRNILDNCYCTKNSQVEEIVNHNKSLLKKFKELEHLKRYI